MRRCCSKSRASPAYARFKAEQMHGGLLSPLRELRLPRYAPAWNVARPKLHSTRSASEKFFTDEAGFVDSSEGW